MTAPTPPASPPPVSEDLLPPAHRPRRTAPLPLPAPADRLGAIEDDLRARGIWPVCGTDEAGRGPLCGPVVAAAVVLRDDAVLPGLDDSKALTEAARDALAPRIRDEADAWAVVFAAVERIERDNILQASLWAMTEAVRQVQTALGGGDRAAKLVLIDGNRPLAGLTTAQRPVIKGDARVRAIAAASVLAKVARDAHMVELDARYPGYGLARHKGYPTAAHVAALRRLGPTPEHRRGFAPVDAAWAAWEAVRPAEAACRAAGGQAASGPSAAAPSGHATGVRGEDAVVADLRARGWTVAARNLRIAGAEADVIAVRDEPSGRRAVVVEVKAAGGSRDAAGRVDEAKVARLWRIAEAIAADPTLVGPVAHVQVAVVEVQLAASATRMRWRDVEPA